MHTLGLGNSWNSVFTVFEFAWHPHMTCLHYNIQVPMLPLLVFLYYGLWSTSETLFEILV